MMGKKTILVILSVFTFTAKARLRSDISDIPEIRYLNTSVDPCEDFFEYTCGNFKTEHQLPDGAYTIDQFTLLDEDLTKLASQILSSNERPEDPQALKKAKAAYQSCTDLDYINLKVEPELSVFEGEHGFPLVQSQFGMHHTRFGWNEIGEAASEYGISMMFNIQAYSNLVDPTKNLIYVSPTNMTLPSQVRPTIRKAYDDIIEQGFQELNDPKKIQLGKSNTQLKPFDVFLIKMSHKLRKASRETIDEEEMMSNIAIMANFMRGIYLGGYIPANTPIENISNNTYITLRELNEWTREHFGASIKMEWVEYMKRVFSKTAVEITEETQVLNQDNLPRLIYGILNWVSMNEEKTVKSFVMMRIYLFMAADGDAESRAILEEYLKSQDVEILPRWKYCTRKVIDSVETAGMSFAVAYEYQLYHFDVNGLHGALEMIRDLQRTYRETLQNVTWMDNTTKANAIEKFDNMITIFGYPDFVPEPDRLDKFYENLRICKWDNYGNTKRMKAFKNAYQISQVAKRDRTFWDKSPFEVNAYYNRVNNKMIFPVAMLNPAFFGTGSSIVDYGRIGSIIGHEITHGFDVDGRKFDSNGAVAPWWTPETTTEYLNRTECFIKQYNSYFVSEIDSYVDGARTLNENLADNGGVRESYLAMKKMLERNGIDENISGFTPEQLFFIGFGTTWCDNPSIKYLRYLENDEHARSKWRVNGVVSNMEEFSEAFNCPAGSKMNPANKCILW
ncbi:hypothetical protein JTB14_003163 [Gonioctena quinquepunctata]|nr:hypothetical protein JTB14_003163 [Gonioctena quinquepunctata]